jgi:hypothetical protein
MIIRNSVFAALWVAAFAAVAPLAAQISYGGAPRRDLPTDALPVHDFGSVDRGALAAEDAVTDSYKEVPWRFGVEHVADIGTERGGAWTAVDGAPVWRTVVRCPGAQSISVRFDRFSVPKGGQVFLWATDGSGFLGAFDHRSMKPWGGLAVGVLAGEELVVEYRGPQGSAPEAADLHIDLVVHGYRGIVPAHTDDDADRGPYGTSGACNINVNCPEGALWATEKRSVALILQGGFAVCSGALVNTTLNDGTPYFLTADHCLGNPGNWVYVFNHESATCAGSTGPTNATVSGGSLVANNGGSDFALILLDETPPASYNVQYAGWDASGTAPVNATGIHHPSGDVKKICFDEDGPTQGNQGGAAVWYISEWEAGVTEGGSSGSPLFDQNHRIIGQLYGGFAACAGAVNNGQADWYGRFNVSWNTGSTAATRLRDWLDPANSGITAVDGWPDGAVSYANDGAVGITGLPDEVLCGGGSITPSVTLTNFGTEVLTQATLTWSLNGSVPVEVAWSGSLAQFASTSVALPTMALADGVNALDVALTSANGQTDENAANNIASAEVSAFIGPTFTYSLVLTLDDYGSETTWEVRRLGNVVYSGGPYEDDLGGTEVVVDLCLEDGCYILEISDSWGDGMCCEFGNGGWELLDPAGAVVASGGQFTDSETEQFCTPDVAVIEGGAEGRGVVVVPNPTSGEFRIDGALPVGAEVMVMDAAGRTVARGVGRTWDLSGMPAGVYVVRVAGTGAVARVLVDR